MYRKIISLISVSLLLSTAVLAQDNSSDNLSFVPKKGNFTLSVVLGKNDASNINPSVLPNYSIYNSDGVVTRLGADHNFSVKEPASITNLAGIALNYFITDKISLSLLGSYGYKFSPAEDAFSGVDALYGNNEIMGSEIPAIQGSPETKNHEMYVSVGANYHFRDIAGNQVLKNVDFCVGGRFNFGYERLEKNQISWLENGDNGYIVNSGGSGVATAEALAFGGAIVGGVDYYFTQSLFIGAEVNAFNFMYQHSEIVKMPGVQGADTHTTFANVFSFPRLKIGFKIF